MRNRMFSFILLSALISVFVFGVLIVNAQDKQPKNDKEKKESTEKKELTEEELKAKVAELVKSLASTDFDEREKAKEELIKLGDRIIPLIKEALKSADDLEVKSKLEEVIKHFEIAKQKAEEEKRRAEAKQRRENMPVPRSYKLELKIKPGTMKMHSLTDYTGIYKYERSNDGSVKVTAMPNDGEEEVREFKSDAEFKEKWLEIYAKFKHVIEKDEKKKGNDEDGLGDNDGENRLPRELEGLPPEIKKMIEELEKRSGKPLDDELFRRLERETNPEKGREGHSQYYRSSRTDQDGNKYTVTIENGKVKAEYKSVDGKKIVKEYDSYEEFKKDWPDFAQLFPWLDKEYKPTQPKESKPKQLKNNRVEDVVFGEISEALRVQLQIKEGEGLLISELVGELEDEQGFFKKAGLERCDVIIEVGGETITSVDMFKKKFEALKEGEQLTLKIIRASKRKKLTITK